MIPEVGPSLPVVEHAEIANPQSAVRICEPSETSHSFLFERSLVWGKLTKPFLVWVGTSAALVDLCKENHPTWRVLPESVKEFLAAYPDSPWKRPWRTPLVCACNGRFVE